MCQVLLHMEEEKIQAGSWGLIPYPISHIPHSCSQLCSSWGSVVQSLQPLGICTTGPNMKTQTFSPSPCPQFWGWLCNRMLKIQQTNKQTQNPVVCSPMSKPLSCAVTAIPNLSKARGCECSSVKSNLRTTIPSRTAGPGTLTRISPTMRLVPESWEMALAPLCYQMCLALVGRVWGPSPVPSPSAPAGHPGHFQESAVLSFTSQSTQTSAPSPPAFPADWEPFIHPAAFPGDEYFKILLFSISYKIYKMLSMCQSVLLIFSVFCMLGWSSAIDAGESP